MRRNDKEITEINDKLAIIAKSKICRIGLSANNFPYIVPLNYGYQYSNGVLTLFFHSAKEGKKIEIMRNNDNVCFEIDCNTQLVEGIKACNYSYAFESIIGFGKIIFLETKDEKIQGLNFIMNHQTDKDKKYDFTEDEMKNICVYKITVNEFTGKRKLLIK